MSRDAAAKHNESRALHHPAHPAALLLVVGGVSLVGAGALLWWRNGASVFVDNPLLVALAWCF
jgi:hypothetical protein